MAGPIAEGIAGFKTTGDQPLEIALDKQRTKQEHIFISNGKARKMERKDSFRVGRGTKDGIMIAAFATLTFLIAMWLCAIVIAGTLEQNGFKIVEALKGRSLLATPAIAPIQGRVSQRYPSPRQPVHARIALRAAA
jgi:hypothetical protein